MMRKTMLTGLVVALALAAGATLAADPAKSPTEAKGKLTAIDAKSMTLTVETQAGGTQTFKFDAKTQIMHGDKKMMPADLKAGNEIRLQYTMAGEQMVASRIEVMGAETAAHPTAPKPH
jgi:hypothetical protein